MGAVFANAPIVPTCAAVQVLRISFDAPCRYCRHPATTSSRPVDRNAAALASGLGFRASFMAGGLFVISRSSVRIRQSR